MDHGPDEVAVSRYATLLRTSEGYAVRRRGQVSVETYPPTDEGLDAAWDRYTELTHAGRSGRLLTALVVVGVVAAVLWFAVELVSAILYIAVIHTRSNDALDELASWLTPFTTVFYALFIGAVGSYAVVWLSRLGMPPARRRR
jgi:hypothetical protein